MKKLICIVVFLMSLTQTALSQRSFSNYHVKVSVHENLLNELFQTINPINGKGEIHGAFVKDKYKWAVTSTTVHIKKGMTVVKVDIDLKVGDKTSKTTAFGKLKISYDKDKNQIKFNVEKISFEIYADVFNNDVLLTTVDLTSVYQPEFYLPGPSKLDQVISIPIPNGEDISVKAKPSSYQIKILDKRVDVLATYKFEKVIKLKPSKLSIDDKTSNN
ncbi:hypothetical protein HOG98_02130 [bacterium]|jgi:hypothetical protein|nr:hypothetical protein [bacterium]